MPIKLIYTEPQAIIDHVIPRLIGQRPSYRDTPNSGRILCMYRGPEGRRCPVGWNIEDSTYVAAIEGNTFMALPIEDHLDLPAIQLMTDMQILHDNHANAHSSGYFLWFEWIGDWQRLVSKHGLKWPLTDEQTEEFIR